MTNLFLAEILLFQRNPPIPEDSEIFFCLPALKSSHLFPRAYAQEYRTIIITTAGRIHGVASFNDQEGRGVYINRLRERLL